MLINDTVVNIDDSHFNPLQLKQTLNFPSDKLFSQIEENITFASYKCILEIKPEQSIMHHI